MTDVKCIRCGTLTIGINRICNICEIELNPIRPSSTGSVHFPLQPRVVSNDAAADAGSIRRFNGVSDVLEPTIVLFTRHFWLITKISVVILAPFEILRAVSIADIPHDWQLNAGLFVLDLLCGVVTAPALVYALMQVRQTGIAPGINESYHWGVGKLPKLIVATTISIVLFALGLMVCVIPGIVVAISLSLVTPIAILEKGSPVEALRSSYELTHGHRWKILGAWIVVFLISMAFSVPAEFLGEYLGSRNFAFWPLNAAGAIFADIMQQANIVLFLVTYLSIRALWSQSTQ